MINPDAILAELLERADWDLGRMGGFSSWHL
jgi:hypothetical protein